jgi:hypothetical protein
MISVKISLTNDDGFLPGCVEMWFSFSKNYIIVHVTIESCWSIHFYLVVVLVVICRYMQRICPCSCVFVKMICLLGFC